MQPRQILMRLRKTYKGKAKVREILEKKTHRLKGVYYEILVYAYIEKLSVENICNKLGFSESLYHNTLKIALEKISCVRMDF